MNINVNVSSIRGGSVSGDFAVGRGTQLRTQKKSFGDKLGGAASQVDSRWLAETDAVHQRLRSSTSLNEMGALLDYYAILMAIRARRKRLVGKTLAAPFIPGAAVLSAAISSVGQVGQGQSPGLGTSSGG